MPAGTSASVTLRTMAKAQSWFLANTSGGRSSQVSVQDNTTCSCSRAAAVLWLAIWTYREKPLACVAASPDGASVVSVTDT